MSESDARSASPPGDGATIVMPAFNEAQAIRGCLEAVRSVMDRAGRPYEIIVVDDGSTDDTAEIARREGVGVWALPENQGYGAALKAGIARAAHDLIVIIDADGSYPAEVIPDLLAAAERYDMVVGARIGENVAIPLERRPAKWVLGRLASYLAGRDIPDLNSGLRVIRRGLVRRFAHLLPSGFSFTTTITLAALCNGFLVRYHPIDYHPRIGESKIRPAHAFEFLMLVLRTIVYFNPLKVFLPLGAFFFVGGFLKFLYDLVIGDLSESAIMGLLAAGILWAIGLLSDQISRIVMRPETS
ncbi:MAG: glycosyltransferase family 2 protein [Candidatus Binatia bacterium]